MVLLGDVDLREQKTLQKALQKALQEEMVTGGGECLYHAKGDRVVLDFRKGAMVVKGVRELPRKVVRWDSIYSILRILYAMVRMRICFQLGGWMHVIRSLSLMGYQRCSLGKTST